MTKRGFEDVGDVFALKANKEIDVEKRNLGLYWCEEYADDMLQSMKIAELRRMPIRFLSKQGVHRPRLLQLCQTLTLQYNLQRSALHLAIYYLDRFLDRHTVRFDKLELVAITCLRIAAQMEMTDVCVPRYSEMNGKACPNYTSFEFRAVERKILFFFKFELMRPTTASFVELLSCNTLTRMDYANYIGKRARGNNLDKFESFEQMLSTMVKLLLQMADYTLHIDTLSSVKPSLLAASCMATVRQIFDIPVWWTPYLTELTTYTEDMISPYMELIHVYHFFQFRNDAYESPPSTPVAEAQIQNWLSPDSGFEEPFSTMQMSLALNEVTDQQADGQSLPAAIKDETFKPCDLKALPSSGPENATSAETEVDQPAATYQPLPLQSPNKVKVITVKVLVENVKSKSQVSKRRFSEPDDESSDAKRRRPNHD